MLPGVGAFMESGTTVTEEPCTRTCADAEAEAAWLTGEYALSDT